jgi:glycosyltransferase involved in cell wall biosynthesis
VDIFLAQSPMVIEMLKTGGVDSSRCRLIPQFIGDEKLKIYPRAQGKPGLDRPFRFVYVGRWSYEKGAPVLLDAFLSMKAAAGTSLWVVSKDARVESILASAGDRLSSDKTIEVFNDLHGGAVSEKLAQCDVCIVPSVNPETGSRVVIEAQSQGVPLIVSHLVGNRYLVQDHVNGRIVPGGDAGELSRAMESVVNDSSVLPAWSAGKNEPLDREAWLSLFMDVFQQVLTSGRGAVTS